MLRKTRANGWGAFKFSLSFLFSSSSSSSFFVWWEEVLNFHEPFMFKPRLTAASYSLTLFHSSEEILCLLIRNRIFPLCPLWVNRPLLEVPFPCLTLVFFFGFVFNLGYVLCLFYLCFSPGEVCILWTLISCYLFNENFCFLFKKKSSTGHSNSQSSIMNVLDDFDNEVLYHEYVGWLW